MACGQQETSDAMQPVSASITRGSILTRSSVRMFAIPCALALLVTGMKASRSEEKKADREEGTFRVYFAGGEIGSEKYEILASGESCSSNSLLEFRNPGESHQKIRLQTKLEMDGRYVPRHYGFQSSVDGKQGSIIGSFMPNQAIFEYRGSGTPRKSGLLVGDRYTVLDANIFHHFVFLARLFAYDSKAKIQQFEVVIPQESDSGILKIEELKTESIVVRSKKIATHHLQADSGSTVVHLWVDNQHVLWKIAVGDRKLEVVRDP
jgi:hypothetical protein